MTRLLVTSLLIVTCVSTVVRADSESPPSELTLDGTGRVQAAAHARRMHLLGTVETYTIAVYFAGSILDRARLASADVAKALRIEVTFAEDPRRPLPMDWRRELVPMLEAPAAAHLRGIFAPLRQGDVVLVDVPDRGTSVRVNKAIAVSAASHDLMLTFLDHWLGQRPVSEEIKGDLLAR